MARDCQTVIFLTSDGSIVKEFDQCVKKNSKFAEDKMKDEGVLPMNVTISSEAFGRCEYIDSEMLKKGVESGGQIWNTISIKLLLVGFGLLWAGGGTL
jgi:hypothetical protein